MFDFKFADIGEGLEEGKILKWNFKVGDTVKEGDILVSVETDKVTAELPSPVSGVITKLGGQEGEVIHVGSTVALIDDGTTTAPASTPKVEAKEEKVAPQAPVAPKAAGSSALFDFKFADIGEGLEEGKILKWNFKVGDIVKEGDILVSVETDKVTAELPAPVGGTITKLGGSEGEVIHVGATVALIATGAVSDAPAVAAQDQAPVEEEEQAAGVIGEIEVSSDVMASSDEAGEATQTVVTTGKRKVLATPVARKLAKDLGVDITTLNGSGPNGRIMKEDITNAQAPKTQVASASKTTTVEEVKPLALPKSGDYELQPISTLRKAIVRAMTNSARTIPHTTLFDEVVVDKLVDLRKQAKASAEQQGIKLTYMAFIMKAVTIALKEFPTFNASFDEANNQMIIKKFYNVGLAVDTPDGLIVPNIKDTDAKSIFALAKDIREVADKTIQRKVGMAELSNATFTISNFGAADLEYGTPIINHPEVGILGVGKLQQKAVVINGQIAIAYTLPLSIAVDHRVIDGADAGRFLKRIKTLLNEPSLLLLA